MGLINSGLIKDNFAVENFKAKVYWSGFEYIIGLIIILGLIISIIFFKNKKYFHYFLSVLISTLIFTFMTISSYESTSILKIRPLNWVSANITTQ